MATFLLLGRYTSEAVKEMGADRTEKAVKLIRELDGEVISMYALLGEYDCFMKIELPNNEAAMKASMGLNLLTGITFKSFPAIPVDDFDRMIGNV